MAPPMKISALQRSLRLQGGLLLRQGEGREGREREGKEEEGMGGNKEGKGWKGKGRGRRGSNVAPPMKISAYAPDRQMDRFAILEWLGYQTVTKV